VGQTARAQRALTSRCLHAWRKWTP
jgi:hypothetical protein